MTIINFNQNIVILSKMGGISNFHCGWKTENPQWSNHHAQFFILLGDWDGMVVEA